MIAGDSPFAIRGVTSDRFPDLTRDVPDLGNLGALEFPPARLLAPHDTRHVTRLRQETGLVDRLLHAPGDERACTSPGVGLRQETVDRLERG